MTNFAFGQISTELTTKKVPFQIKIYADAGHGISATNGVAIVMKGRLKMLGK
jgi:hypothetical protein